MPKETPMTDIGPGMERETKTQRLRAVTALLIAMFFWGTSAVFLRTTALTLAPENALALRYMVLVPLLAAGLPFIGPCRIARADWPRITIVGLAGMFGSAWFTMQGFARVAAGFGTVIQMTEPIIIALLAFALAGEPLSKRLRAGLGIALAGGLVLFWPDVSAATQQPIDRWGVAALLSASTCWAVYTIGAKPLLARYSGFAVAAWSTLIAAPLVFLMASRPYAELLRATPSGTWLEILYLALFNSIAANVLWTYGTRHLPGASAGAFLYVMPVIAVAAGFLWLGEPITPHLVIGGFIVLAGVALAQSTRAH
jgi:drug/metabolite transporter (DMT)-like permease